MSLKDIQGDTDKWAQQFRPPYWEALAQYAQLGEEVGEVGRVLNHMYGPKKRKDDEETRKLEDELADVLFVITCIANREGIDLQTAWDRRVQERLYKRDNQRLERKD